MTVVICGSMRFHARMGGLARDLEALGHRALLPEPTPASSDRARPAPAEVVRLKAAWMASHLDAIRRGDAVLVANYDVPPVPGYVGPSALVELAWGHALGKRTYLLHALGDQSCRLEVLAMGPTLLGGDVGGIATQPAA